MGPQEGLGFYVSTADGSIFFFFAVLIIFLSYSTLTPFFVFEGKVHSVDEHCKTSTLLTVEGAVKKLIFLERREALAVITENLMLSQYTLGPEGGAQEFMKVLLNH